MNSLRFVLGALLLGPVSVRAQLLNGSFEDSNGSSFTGWEWTCSAPVGLPYAPLNGGDWSAMKEPGHLQGCFPSYLFQRIPGATDGDQFTLTGWARCSNDQGIVCLGAHIGFGTVNNGTVQLQQEVFTFDTVWTLLSVSHAFNLGPGDTAAVMLHSGMIGGPINPAGGWFDNVELSAAMALPELENPLVRWWVDEGSGTVHWTSLGNVLGVALCDASGRQVGTDGIHWTGRSGMLAAGLLPPGFYVLAVNTSEGSSAFRLVR